MRKANIKINIPFTKQINDYFCGPASLQMVFNYHKTETDQESLAEMMRTKELSGTKKSKMIEAVKKHGFHYCAKENANLEDVQEMLNSKIPVVVNFIEPSDEDSHYAVVAGASENEIILNDPWNGENFRMLKEEFLKRWYGFEDKRKKWMLAVCNTPFQKCTCTK